MSGKGDSRRPLLTDGKKFEENWNRVFKKKNKKVKKNAK